MSASRRKSVATLYAVGLLLLGSAILRHRCWYGFLEKGWFYPCWNLFHFLPILMSHKRFYN